MPLTDERLARIADACRRGSGLPRPVRQPRKPRADLHRAEVPLERVEMTRLAAWLDRVVGEYAWAHPPMEGKRSGRYGASLQAQGMKRGIPDVLIFRPPPRGDHRGVAIELKRQHAPGVSTRVSEDQRDWLHALGRFGWACWVCYGWEAAARALVHDLGYGVPSDAPPGDSGHVEVIA